MARTVNIDIVGNLTLQRKLLALGRHAQLRVLRPAVKFALTPISRRARSLAPKQSGLLKKAIKPIVSKRDAVGKVWVDPKIVGEYNGEKRWPMKYAHLVEFGNKYMAPRSFIRAARDQGRAEALNRLREKVRSGLKREAARA